MFQPRMLAGHRILITGGGSGLGFSFAQRLAALGANIVICGRRQSVLDDAAGKIAGQGGHIATYRCDIRDASAVEEMYDLIWRDQPLTGLINNAAGNFIARSETLSANAVDSILGTVLHGTAYCTIAAGKRWIEEKSAGTIISIVATAAMNGRAFSMPSAAAKAGVLAMMRSLAVEWGRHSIRTISVAPGFFPTEGAWSRLYPPGSVSEAQSAEVPLGRLGDHGEISNLVAFLFSDMAAYITGDCITIDGGRVLRTGGGAGIGGLFDWDDSHWRKHRQQPAAGSADLGYPP